MLKVYSSIRLFFFAVAAAAIGSVISNIESLNALGGFASLVGGILTIASIYQLRFENRRFKTAFRLTLVYIGLAVVTLSILTASLLSMDDIRASMLISILGVIAAAAILILALVVQYQTFKGFDELRELRQFDYPPRRIMWCFYIAVFSMFLSLVAVIGAVLLALSAIDGGDAVFQSAMAALNTISSILLVVGVLLEAIELWLLFTYMQAAREALESELRNGLN